MSEGQRLAPGIYEIGNELHIDAPEFCAHFGCPATKENVQTVIEAAQIVFEDTPIEVKEGPAA